MMASQIYDPADEISVAVQGQVQAGEGIRVVGIYAHLGYNNLGPEPFKERGDDLIECPAVLFIS